MYSLFKPVVSNIDVHPYNVVRNLCYSPGSEYGEEAPLVGEVGWCTRAAAVLGASKAVTFFAS